MIPLVASSLISGGASLLGNLFGIGGQAYQYAQQKKLIDHQFNKNVEMWNKQNEYNSPSAQMERLQQAGLNPNLVYGNGAVGNTTSDAPQYGLADAPNYGAHLQNMFEPMTLRGQAIAQQIQESKSRQELNGVETVLKSLDKTLAEKTLDSRVKYMMQSNELKLQQYMADIALKENQVKVGNSMVDLNYQQMQVAKANEEFIKTHTWLVGYQSDMLAKQLSVFGVDFNSKMALRRSEISKNYAQSTQSSAIAKVHEIDYEFKKMTQHTRASQESSKSSIMDSQSRISSAMADPGYLSSIMSTEYWKSLTAGRQYQILCRYGMLQAGANYANSYRTAFGGGNSLIGDAYNVFGMDPLNFGLK